MPGPHRLGRAADGIGPKIWTHSNRSIETSVVTAQVKIVGGPNQKNDPVRIALAMTQIMQDGIDVRVTRGDPDKLIPLATIPDINDQPHPDRLTDPLLIDYFWVDANGIAVGISGEPEVFMLNREQTWFEDPELPHLFWDGPEIVTRLAIVTITHDGTDYVINWKTLSM